MTELADRIELALGARPARIAPFPGGGHGASLHRLDMQDGTQLLAKSAARDLATQARMLIDLRAAASLPVPRVHFGDDRLIVMDLIEHDGGDLDDAGERQLAEGLAELHARSAPEFGYDYDVMIGAMPQLNEKLGTWIEFFRFKRLLHGGFLAHRAGRLPDALWRQLQDFSTRIERWIEEPPRPALLHGDLWRGNLLTRGGRVVGLIDPALYFGHPQMDLAFSRLFGGFSPGFYRRYGGIAGLPEDSSGRDDICNLWPLLVHVYLFGGAYVGAVARILDRYKSG